MGKLTIAQEALYTFSSSCLSSGESEVDQNFVNNSAGSVSVTYFARGCEGTDTVTVTANVGDETFTAAVDVELRQTVRMGSFNSVGAFTNGVIASSESSTLVAGDSSTLSLVLVNDDEELVSSPVDIFFASTCLANGLADLDNTVVENQDGTIEVIYTARGCDATDTVTATTTVDGNTVTASVDLVTEQAPVGSIAFFGVDQNQIGIKGTDALSNQATVTFKVTSDVGDPVPNETVTFALDTDIGGITLSNTTATTDPEGLASTVVTAGTVNTPVRVLATSGSDTAESSALSITTGLADQDSFSLSATELNIEGIEYDGITTDITARLADRYNNPVADGTAVNFIAEGGVIEDRCFTGFANRTPPEEPDGVRGACTVTLSSSNPRPLDGRVTVLATAVGEETFADINGNGVFDDGEEFDSISEAFLDKNEDGFFTTGTGSQLTEDILSDFNNDGSFNTANHCCPVKNAINCNVNSTCKCNSEGRNEGRAAVASVLFVPARMRSTYETLHTARPRATIPNSRAFESRPQSV